MSESSIQPLFTVPGTALHEFVSHDSGLHNGNRTSAFHDHIKTNSSSTSSHILPPEVVGNTYGQNRDHVQDWLEAVGLTTQAAANPCRATTESGECILFKEIPLVYANDRSTIVALNSGTVVRQTRVQRAVLDNGGIQGHLATTFCGDPAAQGLSDIFYTVGYAGGRAACSAAALLPAAVIFGQFYSNTLNKATAMWQAGEISAFNAFELASLYGDNDNYSRMANGGRNSFINYMKTYASALFNGGVQRNLSVYAIQFPVGAEAETVDDCSCATVNCSGVNDAELTNSDLYVALDTNYYTYLPTKGGAAIPESNLFGDGDNGLTSVQ
jgi:hypothetical protein